MEEAYLQPTDQDEQTVVTIRRVDQVCKLAAEGLTDAEIARRLSISRHTVVNYWRRLREVYGLSNRTALVVRHLNVGYEQQAKELAVQNKFLAKQNGRLIAENAKLKDESHVTDKSYELCMSVLNLADAFTFKVTANPPYRCLYMSPSSSKLGLDSKSFMDNKCSWFDVILEEDIQKLMELTEKAPASAEQDCQVFRLKGLRPTWILNVQRPYVDPTDGQQCFVGLVLNIDRLVNAGVIQAKVARICHEPVANHPENAKTSL